MKKIIIGVLVVVVGLVLAVWIASRPFGVDAVQVLIFITTATAGATLIIRGMAESKGLHWTKFIGERAFIITLLIPFFYYINFFIWKERLNLEFIAVILILTLFYGFYSWLSKKTC